MNQTVEENASLSQKHVWTFHAVAISAILAFVMNLFSFAILLSQKILRTNKYYRVVLSLAIGDMLASLCGLYWYVRRFLIPSDSSSEFECLVCFVAVCSSFLQTHQQMLLLAAERCLASRGARNSEHVCRLGIQLICMVCSWVFCAAYMITIVIYLKASYSDLCKLGEFLFFVDNKVDFAFIVPILLCLILVLILYSLTIRNITKASNRVRDMTHGASTEQRYLFLIFLF